MAASARIDELRSKFDDNPRRYFAPLANEYRKSGDLETAIAICRTQLRHFPEHMSGHVVLGQALFEAGQLAEARTVMRRAVELDPENIIALRHLGDTARALGDDADARLWYQRVLDADPYNDQIAAYLAELTVRPVPEPVSADAATLDLLAVEAPLGDAPLGDAPLDEAPYLADDAPPADAGGEASNEAFVDLSADDFIWAPPLSHTADPPVADEEPAIGLDLVPVDDAAIDLLAHAGTPTDDERSVPIAELPAGDASEPWPGDEAQALEAVATGAFATETMAELCVRQGHDEQALAIYQQLVAQRPDDADLAARAAHVRARIAAPADAPTAREFLQELSERRPADQPVAPESEPAVAVSARDEWAADAWRRAFSDAAPPDRSLVDDVLATAGAEPEATTDEDLSFDRFFVGFEDAEAEPQLVAEPTPEPTPEPMPEPMPELAQVPDLVASIERPAPVPNEDRDEATARDRSEIVEESEEDLAAFNAWLRGIRDS